MFALSPLTLPENMVFSECQTAIDLFTARDTICLKLAFLKVQGKMSQNCICEN
jgi:hypothetical protein